MQSLVSVSSLCSVLETGANAFSYLPNTIVYEKLFV